jgi:hypothetical protein
MTLWKCVGISAIACGTIAWSAIGADAVARPFQREVSIPLGPRQNTATFHVPEGRQLVIEYVSASANLPFGQDLLVWIETTVNGETATHSLVPSWANWRRVTAPDHDIIRLRQQLRLYADGGTKVAVSAERSGNWGAGSAKVTVSGVLVEDR